MVSRFDLVQRVTTEAEEGEDMGGKKENELTICVEVEMSNCGEAVSSITRFAFSKYGI